MHRMLGAQQVLALAGRVVGMFVRVRGRSAGCEERCGRGASSEALASDPGSRASIGTGRIFSCSTKPNVAPSKQRAIMNVRQATAAIAVAVTQF